MMSNDPKVSILLCTLNGQRFLSQQLDSIEQQSYASWKLWVSDDGSEDKTLTIIEQYLAKWGEQKITVFPGPGRGFAANFISLASKPEVKADYYAFADQDDIWESNKIARAIDWLNTIPNNIPALYCSRTQLINAAGKKIGISRLFKEANFASALRHNIATGNTMIFNDAACSLLRKTDINDEIEFHDWWLYILVSGCEGRIFNDPIPEIRYRQHNKNAIGYGISSTLQVSLKSFFWKLYRNNNDIHIAALQRFSSRLSPQNKIILHKYSQARNKWLIPRIIGIYRSGVYCQTKLGHLLFIFSVITRRV